MDKKEIRITIRLSSADLAMLEAKMADAGYKSAGAFVRDCIANNQQRPKISANTVAVAHEVSTLASMIRTDASIAELLEQVRMVAFANMEGVR